MATYDKEQLAGMTVKALTALAKKEGLPATSKAKKGTLVKLIAGTEVSADRKAKKKLLKKKTPISAAKEAVKKAHVIEKSKKVTKDVEKATKTQNKQSTDKRVKIFGNSQTKTIRWLYNKDISRDVCIKIIGHYGGVVAASTAHMVCVPSHTNYDGAEFTRAQQKELLELSKKL